MCGKLFARQPLAIELWGKPTVQLSCDSSHFKSTCFTWLRFELTSYLRQPGCREIKGVILHPCPCSSALHQELQWVRLVRPKDSKSFTQLFLVLLCSIYVVNVVMSCHVATSSTKVMASFQTVSDRDRLTSDSHARFRRCQNNSECISERNIRLNKYFCYMLHTCIVER